MSGVTVFSDAVYTRDASRYRCESLRSCEAQPPIPPTPTITPSIAAHASTHRAVPAFAEIAAELTPCRIVIARSSATEASIASRTDITGCPSTGSPNNTASQVASSDTNARMYVFRPRNHPSHSEPMARLPGVPLAGGNPKTFSVPRMSNHPSYTSPPSSRQLPPNFPSAHGAAPPQTKVAQNPRQPQK